ncbi:DUF4926 domain-containing protein [Williamsia sp. Leaf354]|uniref:DUF4926 domain-containing protein n=1 Tax=Williamsia sp. Leaf354 TaxID=1736349 RepID=UPI00138ED710|nr:DUF4926 domain-containing protein [Williamsia sp. Leaf354]
MRLTAGIEKLGIPAGSLAVVLAIYTSPREGYEVEVVDDTGETLFQGVVGRGDLEIVKRSSPNG